jgi:hypothetical protein
MAKTKPNKAKTTQQPKQTVPAMLFAGYAGAEIKQIEQGFTTLRAGRKWADILEPVLRANVGTNEIVTIGLYMSVPNADGGKPKKGDKIGEYQVTSATLYPSLLAAMDASKDNNHICLTGQPRAKLEEVIRSVYPADLLTKIGQDPEDGFTVIGLKAL